MHHITHRYTMSTDAGLEMRLSLTTKKSSVRSISHCLCLATLDNRISRLIEAMYRLCYIPIALNGVVEYFDQVTCQRPRDDGSKPALT